MKKLRYIDALRGLAILGVMIVHTGIAGGNNYPKYFYAFIRSGQFGVHLFYVASAFTLFLSMKNRLKKGESSKTNFFIRRFFRIAPIYYLGIIYYTAINLLGFSTMPTGYFTTRNVVSNLFFLHGVNPYWINSLVPGGWSITVEMTFYLIVPFLFQHLKSLNQTITWALITYSFGFVLSVVLQQFPFIPEIPTWHHFLNYFFPNQLPIFLLGIMAFFIIIEKDFKVSAKNILLLAGLMVAQQVWSFVLPIHILFGIGFLILMVGLSKFSTPILVNRFTCFLGKISFSAYLIHFAVLYWLGHFGYLNYLTSASHINSILDFGIRLMIVVSITSVIAYALYNLLEVPFQNLGRKIIHNRKLKTTSVLVVDKK